MPITTDDVKHIAKLVKLDVTGDEEKLAKMFTQTLDYIKILEELDTENIPETYQVTNQINSFQTKDQPKNTLSQQEALSNAPQQKDNFFVTKGVFDR